MQSTSFFAPLLDNTNDEKDPLNNELNEHIFWLHEVANFDYDTILNMQYNKFIWWTLKKSKLEENKRKKEEQAIQQQVDSQRRNSENQKHAVRQQQAREKSIRNR